MPIELSDAEIAAWLPADVLRLSEIVAAGGEAVVNTADVADFAQVHDLVTDLPVPPAIAEAAKHADVRLHIA